MKFANETQPELRGDFGCAWQFDAEGFNKTYPDAPAKRELTVAHWIVYAPQAHPMCPHYSISVFSLKDHVDLPKALIYLEGATHEIIVAALNPIFPVYLDDHVHLLRPVNFAGQIIATDEEAAQKLKAAVWEILAGALSPDMDYIQQWVDRFGDSMLKK